MKLVRAVAVGIVAVLAAVSAPAPASAAAENGGYELREARAAAAAACRLQRAAGHCGLVSVSRQRLQADIVEHSYTLAVGPGEHDLIRVHRVVRERSGHPVRSSDTAFFVPGDLWGFDAAFAGALGGGRRAPSVAVHLAQQRIDVWGIDQRWVLVPPGTTDTTFMRGWGFTTDLSDLRLATTFQRQLRKRTSREPGPTTLVGWSRGGQIAYAYASYETTLPPGERNVSALVAAETWFKYGPADESFRRGACDAYADSKAAYDGGQYAVSFGYQAVGRAALTRPSVASEEPSLTNRELALLYGTDVSGFFNATFHFLAGRVDGEGLPTGLRYTPERRWFRLMTRAAFVESYGEFVDGAAVVCGDVPVPFDDHLSEVRVPVLDLAAAGGFGTTGLYTTTLLGSKDVTSLVVRLLPPDQQDTDFGHVDLWQASDAPRLVWDPLARWVRQHRAAA